MLSSRHTDSDDWTIKTLFHRTLQETRGMATVPAKTVDQKALKRELSSQWIPIRPPTILTRRPYAQHQLLFTGLCKPCTGYRREPSVCLSVRLSVTRWHWVKTTKAMITKSSPTDSPRTLVFGINNSSRNSKGFTLSGGGLNESGVWEICNFQPISRRI